MMINGLEINNLIKDLSEKQVEQLYYHKSRDSRFTYIDEGKEGIVYKFGNYAVRFIKTGEKDPKESKVIKNKEKVEREAKVIKLITEHNFVNFVKFFLIHNIGKYVVYVMQYLQGTLSNWWYDIKHKTAYDYLCMMEQILISIYQMNHIMKFYHNDLKFANVMFNELKNPINLKYNIEDKEYTFETKYIIYMIDFGQSGFKKDHGRLINDNEFPSAIYRKFFENYLGDDYMDYIEQTNELSKYYKDILKEQKRKDIAKKIILSYAIDHDLLDSSLEKKITKIPFEILHMFGSYDKDDMIGNIETTCEMMQKYS